MPSTIKPMSNLNIFVAKVFLTNVMTFQVNHGQFPWHEQGKIREDCVLTSLRVTCQDGEGGQCPPVHQPPASGASRGGGDPGVSAVQGPGQDVQIRRRWPQAAQGGAGPGDHGAQEGPGQDSPRSPEDPITETESGQQKQQWRGEFSQPSYWSLPQPFHRPIELHILLVSVICSKFFLCHSNNVWTMPGTWRGLALVYWVSS